MIPGFQPYRQQGHIVNAPKHRSAIAGSLADIHNSNFPLAGADVADGSHGHILDRCVVT